jgi:uncharacterized protein (DUF1501 family)
MNCALSGELADGRGQGRHPVHRFGLQPNLPVNTGSGTDHAWGNHHIIVGGAVRGAYIYGQYPTLQVNGPDDTSTGRWIPTTAVEQYSATLAKWFGVSPSLIPEVFPYVGRFATADLGFMS